MVMKKDITQKIKVMGKSLFFELHPSNHFVVAGRIIFLFLCFVVFSGLFSRVSYSNQPEGNIKGALSIFLREKGFLVEEGSIHWLKTHHESFIGSAGSRSKVVFLAKEGPNSLRDFYFAKVKVTPDGKIASAKIWNISSTPFACEQGLWANGKIVAVGAKDADEGGFISLTLFDFRGEDSKIMMQQNFLEKIKNSITNYQKTGEFHGIGSAYIDFKVPVHNLDVKIAKDSISIFFDDKVASIGYSSGSFYPKVKGHEDYFDFQESEKAISGNVAWIVDTVRAIDIIGKEKVGWAEAKWYRIEDFFKRTFYKTAGKNFAVQSVLDSIDRTAGGDVRGTSSKTMSNRIEKLSGESIPPVKLLEGLEPLENEGKWEGVIDDAFNLRDWTGLPSLYRTFVRPDPERPYAIANLVAWNPAMVELHVVAGAVEPRSETGRAGTGMIPRDDETMLNLLAGFNGGFQALHGEFGLMQDGKVYLPPKPWAATVAFLKGGRIGFGTWPGPESGEIPEEIISYRQNLTPLIMDSKINPYKRRWWGSSPDLNPDSPTIVRSGVCWTNSNHVIYALSSSVNEITFAQMMKRAGCHYLIQLDVNAGHSGFEFIRVAPPSVMPPLDRKLDSDWEAEGRVKNREDLVFRAKKLFKKMALMRFPRYIGTDPRDFFYLRLAKNLPGSPINPSAGEVEKWKVDFLPDSNYPPKFAVSTVHSNSGEWVKIVRSDPRWLSVMQVKDLKGIEDNEEAKAGAFLSVFSNSGKIDTFEIGTPGIVEGKKYLIFGFDKLSQEWVVDINEFHRDFLKKFDEVITVEVLGKEEIGGKKITSAVGIGPDRFFSWAETANSNPELLEQVLLNAGAREVAFLHSDTNGDGKWNFFEKVDGRIEFSPLVSEKGPSVFNGLLFIPSHRSVVVRLFPETEVVPPRVWNPPQIKRIRYPRLQDTEMLKDETGEK